MINYKFSGSSSENKRIIIKFFNANFVKIRGVSGPNIDQNACGDFFKIFAFESAFLKVCFKNDPRVHRQSRF